MLTAVALPIIIFSAVLLNSPVVRAVRHSSAPDSVVKIYNAKCLGEDIRLAYSAPRGAKFWRIDDLALGTKHLAKPELEKINRVMQSLNLQDVRLSSCLAGANRNIMYKFYLIGAERRTSSFDLVLRGFTVDHGEVLIDKP